MLMSIYSSVISYTSDASHSEKESNVLLVSGFTYPFPVGVMVSYAGLCVLSFSLSNCTLACGMSTPLVYVHTLRDSEVMGGC